MSEKHQECSECGKPLAHRIHSPTYGTHAYREPVASPQATRCESGWSGTPHNHEGLCFADVSAQPAAGTTPCKHECGFGGVHQICQCVECGHDWPNKESEGTTPQAERPDYRDVACKHCHRLRVQQSGICEKCQWDNDLGNFASITGRCPHSSDGKHKPVSGNNIMGAAFTECEVCKVELPEARAVAPVETRLTAEQFLKQYSWDVGFGELAITDRIRWAIVKFAGAFRDKSEAAEIERLKATNRELNRRCQALTHTINTNSDRKTWYGYYQAALRILGWEEEKFKTAAAGLREEIERLNKELEKLK